MKRLMSTVVAVMAFGLFAFADETMEEWFAEDVETVTEALEGEGETDDGVWSNLTDQVEIAEDRIVLDADDATPVAYRPNTELPGLRASVMLTDIAFDAARGVLPELPDGAQAAVAITTNVEGGCVFAVANNGAWEVTEKEADPAAEYAVKVDFTYTANGNTVDYSVSNETGWVSLKSDAVNPVSAKKISTVEFAGSGSFATFAGTYPLPPKGTEGNPWQIGADELQDDVAAWTNANGRLEISGSGKMQDFDPSAPWAGDTVTEAIVGAGVDSIGTNAFAGCTGLKTLVMMEDKNPPELAAGTVLKGVLIFVPAGAEWIYRVAWPALAGQILPVCSGGEYLVSNRLYQVEYSWWDAQGANDIAEELAQFLKQAPAVSADDYFFPYQVLNWYEDVGVFNELTNRIRRLSALCTSCRTGNFIGRNFDWAYDDVEECVMRVPAADGRFASIGIASRFFPEPWQSIFGVEDFLPELTMDGINEKGVAINVNVVPAGDNGATTGTNPGGERLCAGFAVRHVLDVATNAAHAVEILESKDVYSIPFLEFHWMISDSAESYIVECVSNKLVVLWAHDAQPKMSNYYVSHSPSLCEYDVLTNADLTAGFHTPHAMGIERYARVSNGLDRVDSVDAMFTNMTNVWYKLKYLPGNERRYWSDMNGAPVPDGYGTAKGQRFEFGDGLDEARSNAFKRAQENYVAVTNYEAQNHSRTINPKIDPTLTNEVVHTVHTSLYDLEKRTLRVCVQEDYESQFDYALDPVWAIVSADGTRTREFASLSGALAALQDGETLMPAVAGESDLSVKPETFTANDFRAVPVDCPFVITNNDVTVDFRGRVLRDSVSPSTDDDYLVSIVGAMNVSVKNGFLFGTTWRDEYEYASEIDHRGFAVSDGARAIVSNCVVFIAATSNSVSVTEGSRLRFVNCWVDGQGDGAKEVFHAAGASRLRFADTKGFWNPENFWDVTDGVVDTLPAITGEQFTLEDSYLCLDNTIVSNTVTHWSAGKVATPVTFSGAGNVLSLTNDAFITAITGGVAVAKVELSDAGTTLDSNADFIANDEIVCGFTGGTVKKSGSDDAFTYSVITSVTITLPTGLEGCNYVVSNLTTGAEINPSDEQPGGVTYILPIGAFVTITCFPSPGYGVVGTNPYVIPEVTATTMIDTTKLPTVKPLAAGIEYIDENGQLQTNYTYEVVTTATTKFTNGWYAVTNDVEITGRNITVDGAAHLILCDGATLTVTNVPAYSAAIDVSVVESVTNALSIYGQTSGTGGLNAFGGYDGAGIGGGDADAGGNVTINGGIVTSVGGEYGAGIGGGEYGAGGIVTVNGGMVMAWGGEVPDVDGAAGIGGGSEGAGGMVIINDGTVTAQGGCCGAGIGGGACGSGGEVLISGGRVEAIGGYCGAGIGSGSNEGVGAAVSICGGTVTAVGGEYAAGIGGGWSCAGGTVTIDGGTVTAIGDHAAGIGAGADTTGDGMVAFGADFVGGVFAGADAEHASVMTTDEYVQDHSAAFVTMPVSAAARVPQVAGVTYVVSNGTEEVEGLYLNGMNTYVVEPGDSLELYFVLNSGCTYKNPQTKNPMDLGQITGVKVVNLSELPTVNLPEVPYLDWDGKELVETNTVDYEDYRGDFTLAGGVTYVVRESVTVDLRIKVNGTADNPTRLILCDDATLTATKGVEVSVSEDAATTNALIICGQTRGTGTLAATVGDDEYGIAGIGGGYGGDGGIVTVNGGTVTATGGDEAAGIGGGCGGAGGTVMVNGGAVTVLGGYNGSGVGSGCYDYNRGDVAAGTVTVNGGSVTATGGGWGAGIGGGYGGSGGMVTINGGAVVAMGGDEGAGIGGGGGYGCDGGTVAVNGGTVVAKGGENAVGIGGYELSEMGSVVFGTDFTGGVFTDKGGMSQEAYAADHSARFVTMPVAVVSIPQVNGLVYAVSNGTEEVTGVFRDGTNTYAAATGDTLRVYFALQPGCTYVTEPTNPKPVSVSDWFTTVDVTDLPQVFVPEVEYFDWNGEEMVKKFATDYTFVMPGMSALEAGRIYVVAGEVVRQGCVIVNGTPDAPTCLILCDNSKMTVMGATESHASLRVAADDSTTNALIICGQTEGTGELVVTNLAEYAAAGIGGGVYDAGGIVTINGGVVAAFGGYGAAGIGGGGDGAGGTVTINGGTVLAIGGRGEGGIFGGAGIGGGYYGAGGTVTINDGVVTAAGGDRGAGIGGGYWGDGGTVVITGGKVVAHGMDVAEDIGRGYYSKNSGTVTISGGLFWDGLQDKWIAAGCKKVENTDAETKDDYPWAVVPNTVPLAPGFSSDPFDSEAEAQAAIDSGAITFAPAPAVEAVLKDSSVLTVEGYKAMFAPVIYPSGDQYRVMYDLSADGTNDLNQSIHAVVTNINLAAIAAASESVAEMSLMGGLPGFYYTLFTSAAVTDVTMAESRDANNSDVLCDKTGTVTFKNVKKPSDAAGFFTVTASPETPFTEKGLGE